MITKLAATLSIIINKIRNQTLAAKSSEQVLDNAVQQCHAAPHCSSKIQVSSNSLNNDDVSSNVRWQHKYQPGQVAVFAVALG